MSRGTPKPKQDVAVLPPKSPKRLTGPGTLLGNPHQLPHEPTEETRASVKSMTQCGIKQDDMCLVIGVSKPTLEKYYREELDTAMVLANNAVAKSLYQQAINGNVTAQIWWTKTRMGWRETVQVATTNADPELMTDAELVEFMRKAEEKK
jgi:DNA-binding XRE family transcriptional regulator